MRFESGHSREKTKAGGRGVLILEYEQLIRKGMSRTESAHHLAMRNRNFSPKFFEALVTLDPNAQESEIRKCRIEDLIPGMILREEVRSTTGGLLVSRGQEITPTVIFKLRNFHSRRTIAGEITVAMPKTTLSFVKGASHGKSEVGGHFLANHHRGTTRGQIREGVSGFTSRAIT
jgi:hypothetical protein